MNWRRAKRSQVPHPRAPVPPALRVAEGSLCEGARAGSLVRVAQALLPVRFKSNIPAQPRVAVLPDFAPRALRLFYACCVTVIWGRSSVRPARQPLFSNLLSVISDFQSPTSAVQPPLFFI